MSNILFYYLGNTTSYQEKFYIWNSGTLNNKEDKLYIKYIRKEWNISKIYLFTTEKIMKDKDNLINFFEHFSIKKEKIESFLGRHVLNNLNELEKIFEEETHIQLLFRVKNEKLKEKDLEELSKDLEELSKDLEIFVDITHSYRDIPLFYLSLINLIKVVRNIDINMKFVYVREINDLEANIEVLSDIKDFQDWSYAIYLMKKSFKLTSLSDLITSKNIQDLAENFKNIHFYFNINALELLQAELKKLKVNLEKYKNELPLPYKLIENDVNKFLKRFDKDNFEQFQKEIWRFSFENKIYDKAILALREYIISELTSIYYDNVKYEQNRKNIEDVLFNANLMNAVGITEEGKSFLSKLRNARNLIAHLKGYTNLEKDIKNFIECITIEKVENLTKQLIEVFKNKFTTKENLEDFIKKTKEKCNE